MAAGIDNGTSQNLTWTNTGYPDLLETTTSYALTAPNSLKFKSSASGNNEGWINLTQDYEYIYQINFSFYQASHLSTDWVTMSFYNDSGLVMKFLWDGDPAYYFKIYDVSYGWRTIDAYFNACTSRYYLVVTNTGTNIMNYKILENDYSVRTYGNYASAYAGNWTSFKYIYLFCGTNQLSSGLYMDNFYIDATPPTGIQTKTININFYDRSNGEYFDTFNFVGPAVQGTFMVTGDLWSDLNNDNIYNSYQTGDGFPITLTETFTNGDFHYINLSDITGVLAYTVTKAYYDFSTYIQLYNGQTYNFGLTPVGYSEPYNDPNCKTRSNFWLTIWYEACIATDKKYYTSGETVDCSYKMPTINQLNDIGVENTNWRVGIWNYANITDILGILNIWDYTPDYSFSPLVYSADWENAGNWDPPNPGTGTDTYIITIYNPTLTSPLGIVDLFIWDLYKFFYVVNGSFTPSGNITAITPTEPKIGQNVNISFNANNNGKMTYRNLLGPDNSEKVLTYFTKFTGTEYANKRFYEYGTYQLKLYVSDGGSFTNVDTDYFYINTSNTTGPGEYLTVSPYYAIAGYDTIFITYKTEVNDTLINVVDARDQTTPYGTTVDIGGGSYSFDLPPNAAIGTWTVTMYGNDTLTANFSVIADENNFMRFAKNQYFENEPFTLIINHDKKILIRFFKNGVAQGGDLIFEANQQNQGIYTVKTDVVRPSPGDWTAEMWEINNYIEIQLLAMDNCTVIETPIEEITPGYDNILSMLALGGSIFGGGSLGLMVMSLIILIVIIFLVSGATKNKKGQNDPAIIIFITIIGAIVLSIIGWLPWWVTVLAILAIALLFGEGLSKKLNLGGS